MQRWLTGYLADGFMGMLSPCVTVSGACLSVRGERAWSPRQLASAHERRTPHRREIVALKAA